MEEKKNAESVSENFDITEIYTTLSEAEKEIKRRWEDKELRKKVEDFLGEIPEPFRKEPKATLFRFIATPNIECKYFADLSEISKLPPVYVEFLEDKFCTRNQDKICLGKMIFPTFKGNRIVNRKVKKIIRIEESDNKKLIDIDTIWGEKMVDFHHRIFFKYFENMELFDISTFGKKNIFETYVKFLSIFLANGILFENYITKDSSYEKKFISDIVMPAIQKIYNKFGVKPLIVPLLPIIDEDRREWMWYSEEIEKYIK